jgi:hypothetical protein
MSLKERYRKPLKELFVISPTQLVEEESSRRRTN